VRRRYDQDVMATAAIACPVCTTAAAAIDVVDFNKSCEEARQRFLPLAGVPIYYFRCPGCGFVFAPEMCGWTLEQFAERVYNDDYVQVDPDYLDSRPRANAGSLQSLLGELGPSIRHLDYGGGSGLLSTILAESGWESLSYDPFVDRELRSDELGRFDLVTAYEVFEHVPDPARLAAEVSSLLVDDGVVLFTTLLSDGNIAPGQRLTWWYASPRNGHISLYSRRSLQVLAQRNQFKFGSFSDGFHAFWKRIPLWATHILRDQ
jgi:SAM-dependent methyltransferase